jgi:hypothetical protein
MSWCHSRSQVAAAVGRRLAPASSAVTNLLGVGIAMNRSFGSPGRPPQSRFSPVRGAEYLPVLSPGLSPKMNTVQLIGGVYRPRTERAHEMVLPKDTRSNTLEQRFVETLKLRQLTLYIALFYIDIRLPAVELA